MKQFILILLLGFLFVGCGKKVEIKAVTFSETIALKSENPNPYAIRIKGYGRIEGVAKITLMLHGQPYKTEELNGDINFEWTIDWYSNEAIFEYDHGTAKSGKLSIGYAFNNL